MPETQESERKVRVIPFGELDPQEAAHFINWDLENVESETRGDHTSVMTREDQGYYAGMSLWNSPEKKRVSFDSANFDNSFHINSPETVEFDDEKRSIKIIGEDGKYLLLTRGSIEFIDNNVRYSIDFSKAAVPPPNSY